MRPGVRLVLTRSPDRVGAWATAFQAAGAQVLLCPLIDFESVPVAGGSTGASDEGFSLEPLRAGRYDWLVISSITTVRALKAAAAGAPLTELIPPTTRIATIGPSSRRVLEAEGLQVDLAPDGEQSAEGLVAVLPALEGQCVWLPQSDLAAPLLAEGLAARGATVEASTVYRTVDYPAAVERRLVEPLAVSHTSDPEAPSLPLLSVAELRSLMRAGGAEAILAASPSAAQRLAQVIAPLGGAALGGTALIAIGSPTARAAHTAGLHVAATASQPTAEGVLDALARLFPADPEISAATQASEREIHPKGTP
ncbi:uroporphyrinogen-III synthase [Psychromicrobium xiongbiense]|uniref:uroporphyrinogen-III synthase n=1 Tax=Psychromicrobium xiongbiense TaxID=3051184 RepID=UPI002555DA8A|nr:uroporphyrinogen-III synthase [Psychromicrobium sp. YIM S02556]